MFTVKQLSRLAGITPRTLHYYDEIGLLKPSSVGGNGYRYYAEESLLLLQQILLYRELDLPLEQIKHLVARPDFDVQTALESHKTELRKRIDRIQRLIATVDQTINFLNGKTEMTKKQLFEVFSDDQQAEYQKEAEQMYDPAAVKASHQKWQNYTAAEKERIGQEGNAAYAAIVAAIPLGPASPAAQAGIQAWRQHLNYFWVPNEEQLAGLADLYNDDPRFKANFDKVDPRLAEFLRAAVQIYLAARKK